MFAKINLVRAAAILGVAGVLLGATTASAADRRVRVVNETNHTLVRLFAAGHEYDNYADWLGRDVLRPGQSEIIDFDDGSHDCSMAVVAVFSDGDRVVNRSFDVCSETHLTYTGN